MKDAITPREKVVLRLLLMAIQLLSKSDYGSKEIVESNVTEIKKQLEQ